MKAEKRAEYISFFERPENQDDWDHIFEVTLVDPTKNPHIKLKYKSDMDVTMYSYLNKEDQSNAGAFVKRADLYEISIKDEWVYPKSGALFHIRRKK